MLDVGMSVKQGDELFRLRDTTFQNALKVAQAGLKLAEANQEQVNAQTREERIAALEGAAGRVGCPHGRSQARRRAIQTHGGGGEDVAQAAPGGSDD